ncbi:MAG TPA: autotransporter assembly complex family protein [Kiritimatiellia bacterium]|nr:autotransporter assembly complex family protein [Kiritimatiellia bacterium]
MKCRAVLALGLMLCATAIRGEETAYEVRFRGVPEWGMRGVLREQSQTYALRDRPPPGDALLRRRAEQDVPALRDVLRAAGYYGAQIDVQVVTSTPRRVVYHVDSGPRYRLGDVALSAGSVVLPPAQRLGWIHGMPARARAILAAEGETLARVRAAGHPFPKWTERVYTADPAARVLHARLVIEPGSHAVWGETSIVGLENVRERFVRNALELPVGEPFHPDRLDETRARLIRSSLFSSVSLAPADALDDDGRLPLSLTLRERRPRTFSAGVRYTTDEGAGSRVEWEHRNLGGRAEQVRFTLDAGETARSLESRLTLPQFSMPRQRLLLNARAAEENPEAYDSRSLRAGVRLEREWRPTFWTRGGVAVRLSEVDQFDEDENHVFLSFPLETDWNTSRSLLDPRGGMRLRTGVEPFYDLEKQDRGFLKTSATLNRYQRLNRDRTWLLAGRVTVGSISGAGAASVPADERFYAGGGSSVRGYAYQSVGPLRDDEPLGGRSLLELSAELRGQVSESFGAVFFLDGGTAYEATAPDFDEPFLWGAGLGLRYFTAVGPLRADVGFPLDRRDELDKRYQFYLSLGQSF